MLQLRSQQEKPLPNPEQDGHQDDSASTKFLLWVVTKKQELVKSLLCNDEIVVRNTSSLIRRRKNVYLGYLL